MKHCCFQWKFGFNNQHCIEDQTFQSYGLDNQLDIIIGNLFANGYPIEENETIPAS